jgi:hypothetical protein
MSEENSQAQTRKQQNGKLLRLMTGYGQHASPFLFARVFSARRRNQCSARRELVI